ncbi:DUF6493 family protein [Nonomuraea ceibae]|uniref:DUF6493 family protein n=1 Tax=Nonomuraea ceibae TaxID=1935170 RepID=UPI001C5CE78B|nr:DUF6493 family protein [Nonomuraea ceibae]
MTRQESPWDELRRLIDAGDVPGTVAAVTALDAAGRRLVARELPGHVQVARAHAAEVAAARRAHREQERRLASTFPRPWDHEHEIDDHPEWAEPMRIAGAGVLSPAAAAAWITRRDFDLWDLDGYPLFADHGPLLDVIAARPPEWQADVAVRLALRIRPPRPRERGSDRTLPLVLALLRATGVTPPDHDPLVVAYVSRDALLSSLRGDPLLPGLLPRLFTAQGVGLALRHQQHGPLSWLTALHTLAREGVISRDLLLDGCRRRFLLGGDAIELRFFTRLHESLAPTEAEIAAHATTYLRLLPTAPGPVAELALTHLRRLPALDPADLAEALEALLFRRETGLVRAGLSWLAAVLRASPALADTLTPALTPTFGHPTRSVQERAVRLLLRHAARLTPATAATLRQAATPLDDDLHTHLTTTLTRA